MTCGWRFEYQTDHLRHTLSLIYHYRTFILWYLYYINDINAYLPYNATYRVHYFFICVSNCLHLVVIITYMVICCWCQSSIIMTNLLLNDASQKNKYAYLLFRSYLFYLNLKTSITVYTKVQLHVFWCFQLQINSLNWYGQKISCLEYHNVTNLEVV